MSEKFIVVGDIHGCLKQLDEILERTAHYQNHKYVFLGDYIDRGPDSEGVINRLKEMDAIFLMGNHEEMLINMVKYSLPAYADLNMKNANLTSASLEWIESSLIDHYESESYFFVHAGLNKNKSLEQNSRSDFLWSHEYGDFLNLTSKKVIHGHRTVREPEIAGNRININTGCGSNGRLTALVLPEFEFYSSSPTISQEKNWDLIRRQLEEELAELNQIKEELENFGELEEV